MNRETKVGLLVGLCFIACFAVLLSHRSQPGIDPEDAVFEVKTILRGPSAKQAAPNRQSHRTTQPTDKEQASNPRQSQRRVGSPRESSPAKQKQTAPTASRNRVVADGASHGPILQKSVKNINDVAASGLQGPLSPDVSAWSRFRTRRPPIEGPMAAAKPAVKPANKPAERSVDWATRGFQQQPVAAATKAILKQAQVLGAAFNRASQSDRRGGNAMMLTGRREAVKTPTIAPRTPRETYVVQPGDTLSRIARKHYGSAKQSLIDMIFSANADTMANPNQLIVGHKIVLPVLANVPTPARIQNALPAANGKRTDAASERHVATATYVVQPGDSLSRISAKHYGSAARKIVNAIYEANRDVMAGPDRIVVGSRIKLPVMTAAGSPNTRNVEAEIGRAHV